MTQFSFSKPNPVKTNEKKVTVWGKIWAGLSLISLFGDSLIPKKQRDNIPIAVRNVLVLLLIIIIVYLIACGIFINAGWIIEGTRGISFSLGDRFYYFGIATIILLIIDLFYMDDKLLEHANSKKMIKATVNNFNKGVASMPSFKSASKNKFMSIITSVFTFLTFIWVVWGIIFYDRVLFSSLIGISILFAIITGLMEDKKYVKYSFLAEGIVNILMVLFILINHFYL